MSDSDLTAPENPGVMPSAVVDGPPDEASAEQLQSLVEARGSDRVSAAVLALLRSKSGSIPVILVQGPDQGGVEVTGGRGYLAIPWPMPPEAAMQVVGQLMTATPESDAGHRGAPTVTGLTLTTAGTSEAQQLELQARLERYIQDLEAAQQRATEEAQQAEAEPHPSTGAVAEAQRTGSDALLRAARLILLATMATGRGMTRVQHVTTLGGLAAILGLVVAPHRGGPSSRPSYSARPRPSMGIDLDTPGFAPPTGAAPESGSTRTH